MNVFQISVSWWSFTRVWETSLLKSHMTLFRIVANLRNAVVWIASTRPFISKSSSPFVNPLVTVPWAPITIGITVTFMFHSFFFIPSQVRGYYYYQYYYLLIRVFHISVSWWSFTGVWVTASLLKSPWLFSVFWPFSIILLFGQSPLCRQLPNPPGS